MRIGFVCYPTFGGSGVLATELGMELASKGHEVHFISHQLPVRLDFISQGLHFHEVRMEEYPLFHYQPYQLALCSKLVNVCLKYDLELLHVHYAIPHAYAAYMAKQILKDKGHDIKVITTLHGTDITLVGSHPSYKIAVEFSINNSDIVTAVSQNLKKDTLSLFNINKEIEVVYNFINLEKYRNLKPSSCTRSQLAPDNERLLCHVSNFRPVKRVLDVIQIFARVNQVMPSKLLMVGDGPELEKAEDLARKLGIKDKILFMGNSSEVEKILNLADLFILPSETESFGLAALEAMGADTAVISSNAGGLPEVNIFGETGFLADVGDIEAMSAYALEILSSDEKLAEFKEKALENAKRFSKEKIIPQYEKLYQRALEL